MAAVASTAPVFIPPATSTLPFGINVAVCRWRAAFMFAAPMNVPADAEYSSAVLTLAVLLKPPAIRTFPLVVEFEELLSCVAVAAQRAPLIEPVGDHVAVVGSKSSALVRPVVGLLLVRPPATSTLLVERRIAT